MPSRRDQIISLSRQDDREIIREVGVKLQYTYAPKNTHFMASYSRMGRELWGAVQYDLYNIICDPDKKEPNKFIEELISGDIRDLGLYLFTILVSQLSIPASIAIPLSALALKAVLRKYCDKKPKKPKRNYKVILSSKKENMNALKESLKSKNTTVKKKATKKRTNSRSEK
jgi:hypothetical protein